MLFDFSKEKYTAYFSNGVGNVYRILVQRHGRLIASLYLKGKRSLTRATLLLLHHWKQLTSVFSRIFDNGYSNLEEKICITIL